MNKWLLLVAGGGMGTLLRFLLSTWTNRQLDGNFPYGTLAVNLSGCLIIGLLAGWKANHGIGEYWQLFLFIGLLGGFTTFSSFALETLQLYRSGEVNRAIVYLFASNLGGLLLAITGFRITGG